MTRGQQPGDEWSNLRRTRVCRKHWERGPRREAALCERPPEMALGTGTGASHAWCCALKAARRTDTAGGGPETRCWGCERAEPRDQRTRLRGPPFAWVTGGHPKLLYFHSHRLHAAGAALRMHFPATARARKLLYIQHHVPGTPRQQRARSRVSPAPPPPRPIAKSSEYPCPPLAPTHTNMHTHLRPIHNVLPHTQSHLVQ